MPGVPRAIGLGFNVARMVHVRFGSWPPSWPQNEVKVLVDAESFLYSSSIETPGPARPWRENVTRPRSSAGLPRLYPFWIIPSDLFPFPLSTNPLSRSIRVPQGCCREPRAAAAWPGAPGAHARCSRRFGQRYQRELLYMAQVTCRLSPLREECGSA